MVEDKAWDEMSEGSSDVVTGRGVDVAFIMHSDGDCGEAKGKVNIREEDRPDRDAEDAWRATLFLVPGQETRNTR